MSNPDSEYLRIEDAAQFLRVNPRTVYRRIWNGDLPASKVGGIYLIRRSDLEASISRGQVSIPTTDSMEFAAPLLKCGLCFQLLSDANIGQGCQEPGCSQLICTQCLADGAQHCAQHSPNREQKWDKALQQYQKGIIALLVQDRTARRREVNFLNRLQARLGNIKSLIHPYSGDVINIAQWDDLLEQNDERAEIMNLLGKVSLDEATLSNTPLNASLCYRIPLPKNLRGLPLEILLRVFSRLPVMLRDGFDTQPLGEDILTPWLVRLSEDAQRSQVFRLVVLAATTGWAPSAREIIQGDGNPGSAFAHRQVLFYLFDLEKAELMYNLRDDRARRYVELFKPLLLSEELEEVIQAIKAELRQYDSLSLRVATHVLPYPADHIRQAFERLVDSTDYKLIDLKDEQGSDVALCPARR